MAMTRRRRNVIIRAVNDLHDNERNLPDVLALLGYTHAVLGQREEAREYQAQLHELSTRSYVSPASFATLALGLGEREELFKWLEQCYQERDTHLRGLRTDPLYDSLRTEPRYVALMQRAGLPP